MFTVSGLGVISKDSEIEKYQTDKGVTLTFQVVAKDPYQDKRQWTSVSLYVPKEHIEEARKKIVPGKPIQVRIGELAGNKTDKGYVWMRIKTKWNWIETPRALPDGDRKSE